MLSSNPIILEPDMAFTYPKPTFLTLPLELRLRIFHYATLGTSTVTIGTVLSNQPTTNSISGLPSTHTPTIKSGLDRSLLDFTPLARQHPAFTRDERLAAEASQRTSALISPHPRAGITTPANGMYTPSMLTPGWGAAGTPLALPGVAADYFGAHADAEMVVNSTSTSTSGVDEANADPPQQSAYALLAVCAQFRLEMQTFLAIPRARSERPLDLYVSFPHGLCALRTVYPELLDLAKRVYVSGFWTNEHAVGISEQKRARRCDDADPEEGAPNPPRVGEETDRKAREAVAWLLEELSAPVDSAVIATVDDEEQETFCAPLTALENLSVSIFTPARSGYAASLGAGNPALAPAKHWAYGAFDVWMWKGRGGTVWQSKSRPWVGEDDAGRQQAQREGDEQRDMSLQVPIVQVSSEDAQNTVGEGEEEQPDSACTRRVTQHYPEFRGGEREDWMALVTGRDGLRRPGMWAA